MVILYNLTELERTALKAIAYYNNTESKSLLITVNSFMQSNEYKSLMDHGLIQDNSKDGHGYPLELWLTKRGEDALKQNPTF